MGICTSAKARLLSRNTLPAGNEMKSGRHRTAYLQCGWSKLQLSLNQNGTAIRQTPADTALVNSRILQMATHWGVSWPFHESDSRDAGMLRHMLLGWIVGVCVNA